jgi:hypothetical protein
MVQDDLVFSGVHFQSFFMPRRQGGSSDHDLKACPLVRNDPVAGPEAAEKEVAGEKGAFW